MLYSPLPDGYITGIDRYDWRVVAPRLELAEMKSLLEAARAGTLGGEVVSSGRGGTRRLALRGGKVVYVRQYLRGGLVRHFVRQWFVLKPPRPFDELHATEKARAAGCHVPMVHAVAVEERGIFYRGWIVTSAIEGARDFFDVFAEESADRASLLAAAGRAIRELHDAGVFHRDLTGRNLLVDGAGRIAVIDFDRAVVTMEPPAGLARSGRDRFWRSMTKLAAARGIRLEDEERRTFESGYSSSDPFLPRRLPERPFA